MNRIATLIEHGFRILGKKHFSLRQRLSLLFMYKLLVVKRFLRGRLPFALTHSTLKVLGFVLEKDDFRDDFYWIFTEIFVDENYYFESTSKAPLILDCGSNIGVSVIYFKALYPEARIIAFEPSPDNLALLKHNIERNKLTNVTIIPAALGREEGEAVISMHGPATTVHSDFAHMQKHTTAQEDGKQVTVAVHRPSTYIDGSVALLKLDVEGAEGDIIEELDASGKIDQIEEIAMEYHQFSMEKNRLSTITATLEKHGFDYLAGSEAHNMSEATKRAYKTFMLFAKKHTS